MSEPQPNTSVAKAPHVLQAIQEVKTALAHSGVGKDRENSEQRFNFRGIDDILNALAAPMSNAGLIVFPHVEDRKETLQDRGNNKFTTRVSLNVVFNFVSSVDGSSITARIQSEANDYSDKATNKAISFAMKYAYISVFNIPVVGADDGDFQSPGNEASSDEPSAPVAQKAPPKTRVKKPAPVAQTADNNPLIQLLTSIDNTIADKLAGVMQKAYGVKSVTDIPVGKVQEAFTRAEQWLEKKTHRSAVQPTTSDDIPE